MCALCFCYKNKNQIELLRVFDALCKKLAQKVKFMYY